MPAPTDSEASVVIWRSAMLAGSETFIRNHGKALSGWRPTFLGATKVHSQLADETDTIAFPDTPEGRRAFLRLRLTGESPRLRALLTRLRPRVVHAHFGGDGWLISGSAAELGVPLIVTLHGHDVTRQPDTPGVKGLRYRRNLRSVFDRATAILAVSEHIRDKALLRGADPAKVRVHYTGVWIPEAAAPVEPHWDVAFVGRFVAKKGVEDLITALALQDGRRPRALLIGSGPLEEKMRAYAAELGVDATFLGVRDTATVAREVARSRIFVAPSKTAPDGDSEGLPTTIIEAAALGVPTVSTRHSGIPEAVVDGVTGLLGPENDAAVLALNIARLLGDDQLRQQLGAQARSHVSTHFDLREQSRRLEQLYAEVTG